MIFLGNVVTDTVNAVGFVCLIVSTIMMVLTWKLLKKVVMGCLGVINKARKTTVGDVIDGTKNVGKRAWQGVRNTKIFK